MTSRRVAAGFGLICAVLLRLMMPAAAQDIDMAPINAMDQPAFVQKFGGIFEKSPWVAEKAWEKRPFASIDAMHAAMVMVVKYAPLPSQLTLLQNHPDLAGKEAQAGAMTASSVSEQASAGLNALSKPEMEKIRTSTPRTRRSSAFRSSSRCACTRRKASSSISRSACRTTPRPNARTTCRTSTPLPGCGWRLCSVRNKARALPWTRQDAARPGPASRTQGLISVRLTGAR